MRDRVIACLVVALLLAFFGSAQATPIVYTPLVSGVPAAGVNLQAPGNQNNPNGANYYSFSAQAGTTVDVFGDRQSGHYDMSFWLLQGLFADTTAFGASFDSGDAPFTRFGDDQDPANIPGPFGDPHVTFVAPVSGDFTVAVTNFLSSAGPPNPFTLTATFGAVAVPEPATLTLLGLGFTVLAIGVRRRM